MIINMLLKEIYWIILVEQRPLKCDQDHGIENNSQD